LAAKLGEHVDRMDSGVDEIAEDKIDDPVLASEGNRGLGAFPREGKEPSSFAAGEDDAQYSKVQRSLCGEGKFSFRDFTLRQSPLPKQSSCAMSSDVAAGFFSVENALFKKASYWNRL
jgi:hypothetical protein